MSIVSDRIREAMRLRGMRQVDLCTETRIPQGKMSNYMTGRWAPNAESNAALARVLSVNPEWLAGTSDIMEMPRAAAALSPDAAELVSNYNRMDTIDKGKMIGYSESLLAADKYQTKK